MKKILWILCVLLAALSIASAMAEDTSGECGTGLTWVLDVDTGVLTISGSGDMSNYSSNAAPPWEAQKGSITKVIFEEGVTSVGDRAFADYEKLAEAQISSTVTRMGVRCFGSCGSLSVVNFPEGLTSIGDYAFILCSSLKAITLPATLTSLGQSAFEKAGLEEIELPESITSIGACAFEECRSLQRITIPGSVKKINTGTLRRCSALTEVVFGEGVEAIESQVLWICEALKTVYLPSTIKSIGYEAFWNCTALADVHYADTKAKADAIPYGTGNTSLTNATWHCSNGDYHGVGPTSGSCGTGLTWVLDVDTGVLTISGSGDMADFVSAEAAPWAERRGILTKIVLEPGVTGVGANAFPLCPNLTELSLPNNLLSIGAGAFAGCGNLPAVKLPKSLISIGANAFSGCGLTSVTVPENVTTIGADCFADTALTDAYLMNTDLTEEDAATCCPVSEGCAVHLYSKVTFDANGGSGASVTKTVERNTDFAAPIDRFSRDYCRLRSWNTRSDGEGDSYPADTLQVSWNTTLYAQWDSYLFYSLEVYDLLNDEPMAGGVIHIAAVMDDGSGESTVPIYNECDGQGNYSAIGHMMLNLTAEAAEGFQFWGWYEAEPTGDGYRQLTRPTKRLTEEVEFSAELRAEDGIASYYIAAFVPAFSVPNFVLPEGLTEIGTDAFRGSAASSAYVPDGVTYLAARSFADCKELRQIRLPENCEVDESAFEGCGKIAVYTKSGGTTATSLEGRENIFVVVE